MNDAINLTSKTRLKTNKIYPNSMCLLKDRKVVKAFIGHEKGVHIYDCYQQQFQDVKMEIDANGVVSCLTDSDDLVFFCQGMKIFACGFNGRTLFEADTYLAVDKIEALHVYGYQLWVVSGNMVNQFLIGGSQLNNKMSRITPPPNQKMQDVHPYMYDVKINHSLLIKIDTQKPFLLLLKNNNQIQIAQKKDSTQFATQSPPTYGYLYPQEKNGNKVLIGTMAGEIIYVEVERKLIRKLWSIKQNSKGKINCIVEVKNGFMVFRDGVYEMWNMNRQCLGRQEVSNKIQSAVYLPEEGSFLYGTSSGQIVEMYNYEKMMKMTREKNEAADKQQLVKQVQSLRILKEELLIRAGKLGAVSEVSGSKNIKAVVQLSVDYVKLCYSIEVSSEYPIIKLVLRGDIQMVQQPHRILFQGNQNQQVKVFIIRTQDKKMLNVCFKYNQQYQSNNQLVCMVHMVVEGKLIASKQLVDLKYLSMHQKVSSKLLDRDNVKANVLKIQGEFKYHLMNQWLSVLFNDLGSPSSQESEYIQLCYQSIITKNKIYIEYKDKECSFYSESPTPLTIIKKTIFEKSKEKNLSLGYDTKTNIQGLANLLKKMAPKMKQFQQNRKEYELLPGIQELPGESLSQELKAILMRGDEIRSKFTEGQREYKELKQSVGEFYTNYRTLNNWQVHSYQLQELNKQLVNFDPQRILKVINNN